MHEDCPDDWHPMFPFLHTRMVGTTVVPFVWGIAWHVGTMDDKPVIVAVGQSFN